MSVSATDVGGAAALDPRNDFVATRRGSLVRVGVLPLHGGDVLMTVTSYQMHRMDVNHRPSWCPSLHTSRLFMRTTIPTGNGPYGVCAPEQRARLIDGCRGKRRISAGPTKSHTR